jgi:hypothetical protein
MNENIVDLLSVLYSPEDCNKIVWFICSLADKEASIRQTLGGFKKIDGKNLRLFEKENL